MRILVLYHSTTQLVRNTQSEHLYSFSKYSIAKIDYYNVFDGVSVFLFLRKYDLIIFHYTFMSIRWNGAQRLKKITQKLLKFASSSAIKIALPQDEYLHSLAVCDFVRTLQVDYIYTCAFGETVSKLYPTHLIGKTKIKNTFPGFVDESKNLNLDFKLNHADRNIDISYRARVLPYWLGKHGLLKKELAAVFLSLPELSQFKTDISVGDKDAILGDAWLKFIGNSRVVLGCEGGASLHDPDGKIRNRVNDFIEKNPNASFNEVEKNCFPGLDGDLKLYSISPRHFEAALTQTCQVLVEGHYHGVLKPGVHYIPIKRDFSNTDEVLKLIADEKYCEAIAKNAFEDLIVSGKYSYQVFVDDILQLAKSDSSVDKSMPEKFFGWWVFTMRPLIYRPIYSVFYYLKVGGVKLMNRFKIYKFLKRLRSAVLGYNIET